MPFQINGSAPPAGAKPRSGGAPGDRFVLPEPTGLNGQGEPVGAVGYPSYELYFDVLPSAGWAWYAAFTGANLSATLTSLQVWNPYANSGAGGWATYTHAIMHRPIYGTLTWGGTAYADVRIRFTELY